MCCYLNVQFQCQKVKIKYKSDSWAGTAQSVQRLATARTVRGSNPGGGARFSLTVQTGPLAHPAFYAMGTGSFPGVKYGRGMALTTHPHLAPKLRKE